MRRSRRHFTALVALVAFAASFALPFLERRHAWIDDPDSGWSGMPVVHQGTPQLATMVATRDAGHCAICHWMRALGNSLVVTSERRVESATRRAQLVETHAALITAPAPSGPARAPPSSLA